MRARSVLGAVLLGALALPASVIAQGTQPGTVKVGDQIKQATGTVVELQNGDRACYMVMKDTRGKEFTELASFDVCAMAITGKRVSLTYRMGEVMAESCQGDPSCRKKDRVPLVIDAKVMR